MCIIVSKEKGKSIPKKSTLQACFDNNKDGAGFMYYYDKGVIIEKGFMDFTSFYKRVKQLDKSIGLKNRSVVFHFRISTSGKIDKETCHPYPVTDKVEYLKSTKLKCKIGMVHNGILSSFVVPYVSNKDNLNDTQNFVKTFIYNLYKLNRGFLYNSYAQELIESQIGYSRLCFITSDDKIHYFGNFITDKGIKYSNSNYKPKEPVKNEFADYWKNKWKNRYYDSYFDDDDYYYPTKTEKTQEKKQNDTEYYELSEEELAFLSSAVMYNSYLKDYSYYYADSTMCIDEDYNLYKRISTFIKDGKKFYKLKLLAIDVYLCNLNYEELTFKRLKTKVGV